MRRDGVASRTSAPTIGRSKRAAPAAPIRPKVGATGWSDSDADGEVLWAMTDAQGTVRNLIDSNAIQRKHVAFDASGRIKGETWYDAKEKKGT